MDSLFKVKRLLRDYHKGHFTLMELLGGVVARTPENQEAALLEILPPDVLEPFKEWIRDYPLEGGIKIRDSEPDLPTKVILRLKELVG